VTTGSDADSLGLCGTTIEDKYAIESVVGQGGFATVYRATHVLWKRPVAVKVFKMLGEVAKDQREKLLAEFVQEGALLADLSERSTAIVQARDIGTLKTPKGDMVPFMVLEWLEGKPLEDILVAERHGGAPLRSLEATVRLLDPIAEALALAHKKGIAHRDVKPANIFVLAGPDGVADGHHGVKLLDFGIAKVVQDAQKMGFGKTAGHITSFTPLYGAPEQFNRQHGATGPWTDVFALALVVAEVASGQEPMQGDTIMQLAYASADTVRRPTPRTLGCSVGDDVDAIFQRAVAVRIEERFQDAGTFWSALRARLFGESSSPSFRPSLAGSDSNVTARDAIAATQLPNHFGSTGPVGPSGQVTGNYGPPSHAVPQPAGPPSGPSLGGTGGGVFGGPMSGTGAPVSGTMPQGGPISGQPSKAPIALVAAALVGVLALGGVGAFVLRGRGGGATAPAASGSVTAAGSFAGANPGSASAVPSAAAPAAACPPGMLPVPGGELFVGAVEKDAFDFEKPAHQVKLSPYCIDELEVTVEMFKHLSDNGQVLRAWPDNSWPGISGAQHKIYDPLCNINDPVGKAKHPVNCIDWGQAKKACASRGARLPTEAEWELAARGPDGRVYPWGDDPPGATLLNACGKECLAWQKAHPDPLNPAAAMYPKEDDGYPNTAPVGSFPKGKSRYGIQDVVGNVWEWVADYYADYDPTSPTRTTEDPTGPEKGTEKVIRGGGWNGAMASWVRPSFRYHAEPASRSHGFGFRCAKSR